MGELKVLIKDIPDDYEVIFKITERKNGKRVESIAYINGPTVNNDYKEFYLMN